MNLRKDKLGLLFRGPEKTSGTTMCLTGKRLQVWSPAPQSTHNADFITVLCVCLCACMCVIHNQLPTFPVVTEATTIIPARKRRDEEIETLNQYNRGQNNTTAGRTLALYAATQVWSSASHRVIWALPGVIRKHKARNKSWILPRVTPKQNKINNLKSLF